MLKFGNSPAHDAHEVQLPNYPIIKSQNLFHFFVRGVLTATAAELLELQPLGCRLAVLGC
jgi:hypothetical protein